MAEMTEAQARTVLTRMFSTADNDVYNLHNRIEELEIDFQKDPWDDTKAQIKRLNDRVLKRIDERAALKIAIDLLPHEASRETHDINKAWRWVVECHEPYSPDRTGWTDEDIFNFIQEHHVGGLEAFKK